MEQRWEGEGRSVVADGSADVRGFALVCSVKGGSGVGGKVSCGWKTRVWITNRRTIKRLIVAAHNYLLCDIVEFSLYVFITSFSYIFYAPVIVQS